MSTHIPTILLTSAKRYLLNDLISRQEALKELAAYIHLIDKTMGKGTLTDDDCMEAAESVLGEDELPAVQPETNCSEIPNGSDDTISRQAAIDALARMMPRSYTPDGSHPADEEIFRAQEVFADCIEALEILPSAQPEQRWIPVTERLPENDNEVPENDNEVLITVWDAEDDYVEVYKGFYQGHEWWTQWCHGCSKIKDEPCGENIVIAWMPLPEPYQGGEK